MAAADFVTQDESLIVNRSTRVVGMEYTLQPMEKQRASLFRGGVRFVSKLAVSLLWDGISG
jgi:hypothetical protein